MYGVRSCPLMVCCVCCVFRFRVARRPFSVVDQAEVGDEVVDDDEVRFPFSDLFSVVDPVDKL